LKVLPIGHRKDYIRKRSQNEVFFLCNISAFSARDMNFYVFLSEKFRKPRERIEKDVKKPIKSARNHKKAGLKNALLSGIL
jgi:hypothetical protein